MGAIFPLVTNAMFNNLGYPAASSLLGGIVGKTFLYPVTQTNTNRAFF